MFEVFVGITVAIAHLAMLLFPLLFHGTTYADEIDLDLHILGEGVQKAVVWAAFKYSKILFVQSTGLILLFFH